MSANPEIGTWFVVRTVPEGTAPQEIKEQWLNVPLPVRYPILEGPEPIIAHETTGLEDVVIVGDGISVEARDAIKALRLFGRPKAADFWDDMLGGYGYPGLAFRAHEGDLMPADYIARLLPGIENFDAEPA